MNQRKNWKKKKTKQKKKLDIYWSGSVSASTSNQEFISDFFLNDKRAMNLLETGPRRRQQQQQQ